MTHELLHTVRSDVIEYLDQREEVVHTMSDSSYGTLEVVGR
jgi:hypothetical protein